VRGREINVVFRVYLSHSVSPRELGAIYGMAELAAQKGMQPIVADRRWSPAAPPARIVQLLQGLDAFVVIATLEGTQESWVNAELDTALHTGLSAQAVVSVVDAGIEVPTTDHVVTIDRNNLAGTISRAVEILAGLKLGQDQRNVLAGLLLGGLAALLLSSRD
jgi:hypothetical protein